jgi:hypothetical protein
MHDDVEANIRAILRQGALEGGGDFASGRFTWSPWVGRADPTFQELLDRGLIELVSRKVERGVLELSRWRWTPQGRAALEGAGTRH